MTIDFDVTWSDPPQNAASGTALGWGSAILLVDKKPLWFSGSADAPGRIEWSWIELLEFLASTWCYLTTEQTYPLGLNLSDPRSLRSVLESRWTNGYYSESEKDREDEEVFRFEDRHDLARGIHGLHLPSLYVVRQGNVATVATDSDLLAFSMDSVVQDLARIGDKISERVAPARHEPRVRKSLEAWRCRNQVEDNVLIHLATGSPARAWIPGTDLSFWELDPQAGADSELAAAARFSRGAAPTREDRIQIISAIRAVPPLTTETLDTQGEILASHLESLIGLDPYEQGYELADKLRDVLGVGFGAKVDVEGCLNQWGVRIIDVRLSRSIDAIGCWGPKHGPAVLINVQGKRAQHAWGRRATLAHEICHLLVDRRRSLPLAEVLGGNSPYVLERRANAFAGQFLLPGWCARNEYKLHKNADKTLTVLADKYGVGRTLAANQLKHNKRNLGLTSNEEALLDDITEPTDDDYMRW